MRVWIIGDRRHGDSSETRWLVEWQTTPADWDSREDPDPLEDVDWHYRPFTTEAAAMRFARKVAPSTHWGVATVRQQWLEHVDRNAWDWQDGKVVEV